MASGETDVSIEAAVPEAIRYAFRQWFRRGRLLPECENGLLACPIDARP